MCCGHARMQASEVFIVLDSCVYPSSPALALGIVSAVFTIITRIYISVSFGGSGCCRSDPNSTPISKLLFVLSWYVRRPHGYSCFLIIIMTIFTLSDKTNIFLNIQGSFSYSCDTIAYSCRTK